MGYRIQDQERSERGFSIVEMVIVVGLIALLAAIAIPGISRYIRNYKINGASRNVAAEVQTARAQAIGKNSRAGVTFVVVSPTTYRFLREDFAPGSADRYGPLQDLPQGVTFQAGDIPGVRFTNLGSACVPGVGTCAAALPAPGFCTATDTAARCTDPPANFIDSATFAPDNQVSLLEVETGLTRRLRIGTGGRVYSEAQ